MFNTPILYIIFNRLDTVKQTFQKIKEQQPKQLFIAADGPRDNRTGETERCKAVREYVVSQIDWDCDLKTLFREKNLGCGRAVSSAITWFFDNIEQGIILEDDCLPSNSFFSYCEELLNYYKDDTSVMHITGDNPLTTCKTPNNESYYFSKIEHCWGWATWRRAWKYYEFNLSNFDNSVYDNKYFKHSNVKKYWKNVFSELNKGNIDTWDYQWTYAILKNNGYCINPAKNQITNIGFSSDSTHFSDNKVYDILSRPSFEISEIIYPLEKKFNNKYIKKINSISFGIDTSFKALAYSMFILPILSFMKLILKKKHLFNPIKSIHKIID